LSLATVENFEARHGEVSVADEEIVQTLLDDAGALIAAEVGDVVTWDADPDEGETATPQVVIAVCVGAAFRAWKNPAGVRSEQLGQASVSYSESGHGVWLTDRDLRTIRKAAGLGTFRAATLESPYSGPGTTEPELPL
jgi:hypothetical protein